MATVGQRIREIRIQKGMTQTELAKDLVTPSMISQIEAGKTIPSQALVQRLAERMQTPIELLLVPPNREQKVATIRQVMKACIAAQEFDAAERLMREIEGAPDTTYEISEISGLIHAAKGRLSEASACFSRALSVAREREDWSKLAEIFVHLGDLYEAASDFQMAIHMYTQAQLTTERFWREKDMLEVDVALRLSRTYHAIGESEKAATQLRAVQARLTMGDAAKQSAKEKARQAATCALKGDDKQARRMALEVTTASTFVHFLDSTLAASFEELDQLLAAKRFKEAETLLTQRLDQSEHYMSASWRALFLLAKARLLVASGSNRESLAFAIQALSLVDPPTSTVLDQALLVSRALMQASALNDALYLSRQIMRLGDAIEWSLVVADPELWLYVQEAQQPATVQE